jgi:hypothetical protein
VPACNQTARFGTNRSRSAPSDLPSRASGTATKQWAPGCAHSRARGTERSSLLAHQETYRIRFPSSPDRPLSLGATASPQMLDACRDTTVTGDRNAIGHVLEATVRVLSSRPGYVIRPQRESIDSDQRAGASRREAVGTVTGESAGRSGRCSFLQLFSGSSRG